MIDKAFISDLVGRIDLPAFIGEHVELRPAGAVMQGLCPFHEEKTPSFKVMPDHYHCYGCSAHGNALVFSMEHLGDSFIDAVKRLATRAGVAIPDDRSFSQTKDHPHKDLRRVLQWAGTEFRRHLIESGDDARQELLRRQITDATAERFGVGYAPDAWNWLTKSTRFNAPTIRDAGLSVQGTRGYYDLFRHRLMFPIFSRKGSIIGFGGRRIGNDGPKYINSPETPLYCKGDVLFGLFQAQAAIRLADEAIVVEGYFDVLTPAQHGVANIVAPCGTALTSMQLHHLLSLTDNVVMCLDGDLAGRKATWRVAEMLIGELGDQHQVRFAQLPAGQDPDSLVRDAGPDAFRDLIAQAPSLLDYLCRELARGADRIELRARAVTAAIRIWRLFAAPIQAELFRIAVCRLFNFTDGAFLRIAGERTVSAGNEDLRYCLSCGQHAARRHLEGGIRTRIVCGHCGLSTASFDDDDAARMAWNRRERREFRHA